MTLYDELKQMKGAMKLRGYQSRYAPSIPKRRRNTGSGVVAGSTICKQFKWPAKSMRSF